MQKITVYGLPLNPTHLLEQLKGASFCVSYATRDKLGAQLEQAMRLVGDDGILMIDNGAFSMHAKGTDTRDESYQEAFEEWANDILDRCPNAVAVIPDVIGGTEEENSELAAQSQLDPDRSMAVWHLHESLEYLTHLCESYGYVAFGSSGQYWKVGTPEWHARVAEAFAAIDAWEVAGEGAYVRPRIHMMRAQAMAHLYAFDSSDSTNVAMNHGRYKAQGDGRVATLAARVDGKIQASAGPAVDHQLKRPLLDHQDSVDLLAIHKQKDDEMIWNFTAEWHDTHARGIHTHGIHFGHVDADTAKEAEVAARAVMEPHAIVALVSLEPSGWNRSAA